MVNERIKTIEAEIAKLEEEKNKLIEENKITGKIAIIHVKFSTTIENENILKGNIRSAIYKGFDLMGIAAPPEIKIQETVIIDVKEK